MNVDEAADKIAGILTRDVPAQENDPIRQDNIPRSSFRRDRFPDTRERARRGLGKAKERVELPAEKAGQEKTVEGKGDQASDCRPATPIPSPGCAPGVKTCTSCGIRFQPYKNGIVEPDICRTCLTGRIQEARSKSQGYVIRPVIKLDFGSEPELYARILETAANERRAPFQQILYWIEKAAPDA